MDSETLLIVVAAFFAAAFAKGVTGLGFSTACVPMLTLAVGIKTALPLMIIPSLTSNLLVMLDAGHFREVVARFWLLFLSTAPGLVLGLVLLNWLDPVHSAAVLGATLIAYAVFALANPALALPAQAERPLAPATGFLTGTINGLTGSQLIPVLPYLLALRLERERFVQAINCSFTFSSLIMAVGLAWIELMTVDVALVSTIGLVPVFLGIKAGGCVRRRLAPERFRQAVLVLLILAGITLVLRAL